LPGDGSNINDPSQIRRGSFRFLRPKQAKVAVFVKWLKYGQFRMLLRIFALDFRSARL